MDVSRVLWTKVLNSLKSAWAHLSNAVVPAAAVASTAAFTPPPSPNGNVAPLKAASAAVDTSRDFVNRCMVQIEFKNKAD